MLWVGRLRYDHAVWPCLLAAFLGRSGLPPRYGVCTTTVYRVDLIPALSAQGLAAVGVAGVAFGLMARAFARGTHAWTAWVKARVAYAPLRPFLGGAVFAAAVWGA